MFSAILDHPGAGSQATLYIAEHESKAVAALIMLQYNDAGDSKYEGVDETRGAGTFLEDHRRTQTEMPYYFDPPVEGVSVARTESRKYRVFTGAFRRMPAGLAVRIGERIFRHFG